LEKLQKYPRRLTVQNHITQVILLLRASLLNPSLGVSVLLLGGLAVTMPVAQAQVVVAQRGTSAQKANS